MIYNMNDKVKVKLTDAGVEELERQYYEMYKSRVTFTPPKTDDEGYTSFQLWSLMEQLGHMCVMGCEPPFDTDILFPNA